MFELPHSISWSLPSSQILFQYLPYLGICGGLLGVGISFSFLFGSINTVSAVPTASPEVCLNQAFTGSLVVYVSGAVVNPGIYTLESGKRIAHALEAAGGILETTDSQYLATQLNLAEMLVDGANVYVPFQVDSKNTVSSSTQSSQQSATAPTEKVSINTASQSELEALPKIGEKTAEKLISLRPYQTIGELVEKKVLTAAVLSEIKGQLTE